MNPMTNAPGAHAASGRPEQPLSVHHFSPWGAAGRTAMFLIGAGIALVVGLGSLGACLVSLKSSGFDAALWGLFALCGLVGAPAAGYEALRVALRTPSVIAVYRTGLRWRRWGREESVGWDQIGRVERDVTFFVHAGREHRTDTTTIRLASGETFRIWAETLSDYPAFADAVKHFHDSARFTGTAPNPPAAGRQRAKSIRCWHCGTCFDVTPNDPPAPVRCPGCRAGLGTINP
jgi:hypothetical protein